MFVANDFAAGYVNGSRGVVVGFNGGLPGGRAAAPAKQIAVHAWVFWSRMANRAEVSQLSLRLAWAITVQRARA